MVDGKVALVTGAASGIGEASARLFAQEGAIVVLADIDGAAAAAIATDIGRDGGIAGAVTVDVTDEASVAAMVAEVVRLHGHIDCAHNNAGISGPMTSLTSLELDDWNTMLTADLTSVFLCMKHELAVMTGQGSGAIVNTASGAGLVGYAGLPHYVAAKHGVLGLTKSAALEFAHVGLRVNAICPGATRTPMIESFIAGDPQIEALVSRGVGRGALGEAIEVAQAAVWLCSDRASFVNGESLVVDGATICR